MNPWFLIILVAVIMEPMTALIHRAVMHKFAWSWHKSHHDRFGKVLEYNDFFPIVFSAIAIILFVIGIHNPTVRYVAIGITIYGALYFVVHEIIIHSRFGKIPYSNPVFRYWQFGHNVHHQFHKEPYGFIVPVTPKKLANQARQHPRDLINRFGSKNNDDLEKTIS